MYPLWRNGDYCTAWKILLQSCLPFSLVLYLLASLPCWTSWRTPMAACTLLPALTPCCKWPVSLVTHNADTADTHFDHWWPPRYRPLALFSTFLSSLFGWVNLLLSLETHLWSPVTPLLTDFPLMSLIVSSSSTQPWDWCLPVLSLAFSPCAFIYLKALTTTNMMLTLISLFLTQISYVSSSLLDISTRIPL